MKVATKKVVDRLATPTPRKKYKGEGLCLGAQVIVMTEIGRFPAQIWALAPKRSRFEWFWVVDANGKVWGAPECDLMLIGQAREDGDTLAA
jgi:hypothetical protein